MRSRVCLRSRYAEAALKEATAKGVRHYVVVFFFVVDGGGGAGFDTFALRQPDWARALRIVEIDHPATQAAKRAMLAKAGFARNRPSSGR